MAIFLLESRVVAAVAGHPLWAGLKKNEMKKIGLSCFLLFNIAFAYPQWTKLSNGLPPQLVTMSQAGTVPTQQVIPANQNVPADTGRVYFTVLSDEMWQAQCYNTWCYVTLQGSGNGILEADYTQNYYPIQRIATITVFFYGKSYVNVTVTQAPGNFLTVSPFNRMVGSTAGNTYFIVSANTNWNATSDSSWCSVNPSGSGNDTIFAAYSENISTEARVDTIRVSSAQHPVVLRKVIVTQKQAKSLSVSPTNRTISSTTGITYFIVSSNTNWDVTSDSSWCSVTPSGSGNDTIFATCSENISTEARVDTIRVFLPQQPDVLRKVTVTQGAINGIKNISEEAFQMYPNPAKNKIIIKGSRNTPPELRISIFTITGVSVFQNTFRNQNQVEINVNSLKKGIYLVKIQTISGIEVQKLVIQ
jgi:hypothetical protein